MPKPRIFIYIHYLEIGGAERALLGMLHAIDPEKVDVDLFVNQHTGELLDILPDYVNLLPEIPAYSAIERPIKQIVKEGHLMLALRRMRGKYRHSRYHRTLSLEQRRCDESIFQYIFRSVTPGLPSLKHLGEYDLAISYLHPHNIVLEKVDARRKLCWIHTDYSTIHVNHDIELPIWAAYDAIASISDEASKAFVKAFPEVEEKLFTFENILPAELVRRQAEAFDVTDEMPDIEGSLKILSIGRYSLPKRFYDVPRMCRIMLDKGLKFKWYIIGFGNDADIRANIDKYDVGDTLILLGKKSNPYPYIKACDIYAQPSLYEGKSVTVREAQILCRPAVISNYPTASSQITNGVDGAIVPLDVDACAGGIYRFALNERLRSSIVDYLSGHDYGATSAIELLYRQIDR